VRSDRGRQSVRMTWAVDNFVEPFPAMGVLG
jgi:hypothetical protein